MWLDDDTLAVLAFARTTQADVSRLLTATRAALGGVGDRHGRRGAVASSPWPRLAGVGDDGSILVFQGAGDAADCDRAAGVRPGHAGAPVRDVAAAGAGDLRPVQDGVLTWIGTDGALHVGDTVVPGEYRWARPVS